MKDWIKPGDDVPELLKFNSEETEDSTKTELECSEMEIESISQDKTKKTDTLAKKFINLIGQGYKPGEAAKLVGTNIRGIMSQKQFKEKIKVLVETYDLSADIRRKMVRAGMNQIAIDNLSNPDPSAQKLALDALKAIGSDTEVGINAPPAPGIQINVGSLQGLFADTSEEIKDFIDVEVIENDVSRTGITEKDSTEILDKDGLQKLIEQTPEIEIDET